MKLFKTRTNDKSCYFKSLFQTLTAVGVIALSGTFATAHPHVTSETRVIGLTQIVRHPSLDAIAEGVAKGLCDAGYCEGKNLHIHREQANGRIDIAASIAHNFVGQKLEIVIALATPSAQTALRATKGTDVQVVFGAVTDPLGAGLVTTLDQPSGGNVTGTIDPPLIEGQLALMQELIPNLSKVGVVYNPGEANSVSQFTKMKALGEKKGLTIVAALASKTVEVGQAAEKLTHSGVQAIYIPNDNLVVVALEAVVKAGFQATPRIPVFTSDPDSVVRGATAALAHNQFQVGVDTGRLAAEILSGKKAGTLKVVQANHPEYSFNLQSAKKVGLKIPTSLLKKAVNVTGKL